MKKLILSTVLMLPMILSAQSLERITENGKSGWRLSTANPENYGPIGNEALDLSSSSIFSNETIGATGDYSTAMGLFTTASGGTSTAMGFKTTASGLWSTSMGNGTTADGDFSTAIGLKTTAAGDISSTMGFYTTASDASSLSIGQFNAVNSVVTSKGSDTVFHPTNAAFVIGNGTFNARSDAFVVYFNGNATLAGELSVNSDARLKDNIQPLGSTLDKLHQIEGKTYTLLKDEERTPKIGVLAQEVQSVFPELVSEGVDGTLSVNYQGLVPVLINAINEQEAEMSEQDAKIAALEAQNEEIKEMLRALTLQQSFAVKN